MGKRKVLILELGGIGDVVMSLPAIEAVLNSHGNGNVDILTVPRTKAIIESLKTKGFENFSVISTDALDKGNITNWLQLIKKLRSERYDTVIDLSAVETFKAALKRWLFLKSTGAEKTFGRNTDGRGWGFTKKTEESLTSNEHEVERKIKVVELLGLKADRTAFDLVINNNERKEVDNMLSEWLNDKRLIAGINPGAYRPSRMWPAERFKDIMGWLIENLSASIVVIGGDREGSIVEDIVRSLPEDRIKTVIGIPIMKLAAVIEKTNIFITNDTGPMHIAAALNIPTIALFGQTNLHRYHPYMDNSRYIAIKKDHALCPCFSFKHPMEECRRYDCAAKNCMDAITVDEVKEAVIQLEDRCLR